MIEPQKSVDKISEEKKEIFHVWLGLQITTGLICSYQILAFAFLRIVEKGTDSKCLKRLMRIVVFLLSEWKRIIRGIVKFCGFEGGDFFRLPVTLVARSKA
jgi:hypothetical protein